MRILTVLLLIIAFQLFSPSAIAQSTDLRTQTCLNGWWDFQPVYGLKYPSGKAFPKIPAEGWLAKGILVPGSWSSGSSEFGPETEGWEKWQIARSFDVPAAWDSASVAWYRTTFNLDDIQLDRLYALRFDGILRESWIYVNGIQVGHRKEETLPSMQDVSRIIKKGLNEIVVLVSDYKRDENGRTLVDVGADQMGAQHGIWGDVYLESKPNINVQDLTIRTSTRKNELTIIYTIQNNSEKPVTVTPKFKVDWQNKNFLSFADQPKTIAANGKISGEITVPWSNYIPWSTNNPQLYFLNLQLESKNGLADAISQRFGFREIWIEGHNFILNGNIIHMLGEWGHKDHFGFLRPEYVRQWFGMLRDMNMNYIRTHTFPHPQWMIDIADEMGIMVCLESGWFMSGQQAMDKPEYWDNAKEYAANIVDTYKNHPSIILWSVGNEVRWGWNLNAVIKHGPEIQAIYEQKDPTRIAYSDGSTSLWDERSQKIISRHYGTECTGEDFWDKSKPLHVGEFGKWHYGQPIDNLVWGNDEVFASFRKCAKAIADEGADVILQGRSNEVSCMFPWNLSCLDNYRPSSTEIRPEWNDFGGPYAKPTRVAPYSSEFAWWLPESKGYIPGEGFQAIQHANRPFALYIREKSSRFYDDAAIIHTVSLINDLGNDCTGNLQLQGFIRGKIVFSKDTNLNVPSGRALKAFLKLPKVKVDQPESLWIVTRFLQGSTVVDAVERSIEITSSEEKIRNAGIAECLVFGSGSMRKFLQAHEIKASYLQNIEDLATAKPQILIVEKNAIVAGSQQNKHLSAFVANGGKVFLMEQENNALPEYSIDTKPTETAFVRGYDHPVMNEFTDADFAWWGNDPYGKSNSTSYVTVKPYQKPQKGNCSILLDCGFGDFGSGGLNWTPLFELASENGLAVVSQLRLTENLDQNPVAGKLILKILTRLNTYSGEKTKQLFCENPESAAILKNLGFASGSKERANVIFATKAKEFDQIKQQLDAGKTVIASNLDSLGMTELSKILKIDLHPVNLGPQYNLIRAANQQILNGISNQETNWLDRMTYTDENYQNHKITDWLMKSSEGISLLESESESCWREYYTKNGSGEWLRMPVVTHLLYNGPRDRASGMMQFNIGKGKLLLVQVPLPETNYRKSNIFWSQILNNLGVACSFDPFTGAEVQPGSQQSNGYAGSIRYISNPAADLLNEVIKKGDAGETSERFQNQGLNNGFAWEKAESKNGLILLPENCKEIILYSQIFTGRPRKLSRVAGDWPDPMQQTLVDLAGKGVATLYVNGKKTIRLRSEAIKQPLPISI